MSRVQWTLRCYTVDYTWQVMNCSRKRDRRYCAHCDTIVASSTYYLHRANFYDADSKTWVKQAKLAEVYCTSSEGSSHSKEGTDSCPDDGDSSFENPILTDESPLPGIYIECMLADRVFLLHVLAGPAINRRLNHIVSFNQCTSGIEYAILVKILKDLLSCT